MDQDWRPDDSTIHLPAVADQALPKASSAEAEEAAGGARAQLEDVPGGLRVSDLAAMEKEVDVIRKKLLEWISTYDFNACDAPGCIHPNCRGKTIEQRKADGQVLELSSLQAPDLRLTR
jgi:hypothetical protein